MNPPPLTGKRILVTGVTGMVAGPMAARLAADNTVYGAARFADPDAAEGATRPRASPRSASTSSTASSTRCPTNSTTSSTSRWRRPTTSRATSPINADGAAHLMEKVQGVDAFFHCSSGGVYQEHEHDHLKEDAAAR